VRTRPGALVPILAALAAAAGPGCGAEPLPTPVEATYGPSAGTILTPFPSDRYTVADASSPTGRRVRLDRGTTADPVVTTFPKLVAQLGELDGFSTIAGVTVSFGGPLDLRGLVLDPKADPPVTDAPRPPEAYATGAAPLALVDVDPASPERGKLHPLLPSWSEQRPESGLTVDYTLVAQPTVPLRERTRHLFVVTRDLRARSGGGVQPSEDMLRVLRGRLDGGDYERELDAALGVWEERTGRSRREVAVATVFTTESVVGELARMARAARARPAPRVLEPFTVERAPSSDGRVRFRVAFEAPELRTPAGTFQIEGGAPKEQGKAKLEAFVVMNDAGARRRRPVVIYQHGLGGDKDATWGTAERLASLGACVIGIDSPEHGSRAPAGARDQLASITAFLGVDIPAQSFDIARARDNFRQMASDQLELVRFVRSLGSLDLLPLGAPDGEPDLDVSRVLYIGHSFGSVQGATIAALAPEIEHAVWNVGGGALTVLLRDSPLFAFALRGLQPPGTPPGALSRFFVVAQALVERGDPAAYARYATLEPLPGLGEPWRPRDVLLQEAINDGIVPNSATAALARSAGLVHAGPVVPVPGLPAGSYPVRGNLPGGGTGALAQFDRMNGAQTATHGDLIFAAEARRQYVEFFRSALESGRATVRPAY